MYSSFYDIAIALTLRCTRANLWCTVAVENMTLPFIIQWHKQIMITRMIRVIFLRDTEENWLFGPRIACSTAIYSLIAYFYIHSLDNIVKYASVTTIWLTEVDRDGFSIFFTRRYRIIFLSCRGIQERTNTQDLKYDDNSERVTSA